MRKIGLVLVGVLVGIGKPAYAQELPVFEFKGFRAGEIVEPRQLRNCQKRDEGVQCRTKYDKVAGYYADTRISFFEGKLSSVYATMGRGYWPAILEAFTTKYGAPCKSETEAVKTVMGLEVPRNTTIWCFQSGKLELESVGPNISTLRIFYADENRPPKKEPVVDF